MSCTIYRLGLSQSIVLFCHIIYVFNGLSPQLSLCNMKTVHQKSVKDSGLPEGQATRQCPVAEDCSYVAATMSWGRGGWPQVGANCEGVARREMKWSPAEPLSPGHPDLLGDPTVSEKYQAE